MQETGDDTWKKVGSFSRFDIMGCGNKRRLVDPATGYVYREYTVPVERTSETPPINEEAPASRKDLKK